MIKLLGNFGFLVFIYLLMMVDPDTEGARTVGSHYLLAQRIGMYGILSMAAGVLIISGGIDLSMGSTIALTSTVLVICMVDLSLPPAVAIPLVLLLGALIGLFHGILVTYVGVQAFIVTLCGLFLYRGFARTLAEDSLRGFGTEYTGLKDFLNGDLLYIPVHFWIMLVVLVALGIFLHFSVYGRYLYAIGSNERAAQYCGIPTTRYRILAYVLCSVLTVVFGILLLFKNNSVMPSSTGSFMELYGIAGAVIGGCSLRGGDGNVIGMLLGTCVIAILPSYVVFKGFPSYYDQVILGGALLLGAIADELLRRYYYGYKKA
jgi:ribose transport system permease protein